MKAVVIIMGMLYSSPLMADVLCEKDSVSRTISVVYARPGLPLPCEVVYEKSETKEIETLWNATIRQVTASQKQKNSSKYLKRKVGPVNLFSPK